MGEPTRATTDESASKRAALLLASATLVSLVITILAGFLTRLSLVDSTAWVRHTGQVKLALADGEVALARGDAARLASAEAEIARLTMDNPVQQANIARAATLGDPSSREALQQLFSSMQAEEDRLMAQRLDRMARGRAESSVVFVIAALLTLTFGGAVVVWLRAQRRDLARERALLQAVLESVDEGILAVDPSRRTIAMNAVTRKMVGRAFPLDTFPEDWRAHLRIVREDGSSIAPQDAPLARALRGETSEEIVYRIVPPGAEPPKADDGIWVSNTARPIRDATGRVVAAVATLRDITEQRANAERLRDLSLTDELTGLLNRRGFLTIAGDRIAAARRARTPLALLYADVNGLKKINDQLGHEQGDRVIQDAASVLRTVFREGDVVARIGGDEFVALLPNFTPAARDPLLERIGAAVRAHAAQGGRPYRLSLSAGVTFMDWDTARTLDDLLADADQQMYQRKRMRADHSAPVIPVVRPDRDG